MLMPKLKVADFYYGSVLSLLFNNHIVPALVEGNSDRQVYDLTTNQAEFRLFIKYRSENFAGAGEYKSWQFVFSESDLNEIASYIDSGKNLLLALVCGSKKLNESELAILNIDDIEQCLGNGKTSLTISRDKGEKAFRISIGGGRDNSIKVPSNRFIG